MKTPPPKPVIFQPLTPKYPLCRPNPLDSLSQADVRSLELVQSQPNHYGCRIQAPGEDFARAGCSLLGDIIDDDVLEAGVRVDEDCGAEDGVQGRVERASRERSDGERDERGSNQAIECPVVRTVGRRRGRYGGRVVH